jgi:hypothetical protein
VDGESIACAGAIEKESTIEIRITIFRSKAFFKI